MDSDCIGEKYVTLSGWGWGDRLKGMDMTHYWIWFDLFMS